jgi:Family of unknown function (DUF5906)
MTHNHQKGKSRPIPHAIATTATKVATATTGAPAAHSAGAPVTETDFHAYLPAHRYIFTPSGDLWPASSVNAKVKPVLDASGDRIQASVWLDHFRSVDQMVWAPGKPSVIADRLVNNGGWITRKGCNCYNLYREPTIALGDPMKASRWVEHIHLVFPGEAEHIINWLAHRRQHPGEKINHGLVIGGNQGIGKDTLLEPVKYAVGPWNFIEISPTNLLGQFNPFVKSVILRVSEARDLGDINRYSFYDHMKVYTAAPPDVLTCNEKHLREQAVFNVCGVIITTNYKTDGIYLPADDRRHFVAWSQLGRDSFSKSYFNALYRWYHHDGGLAHVAAYLQELDLSEFDAKAPPPKTAAFHDIVDANRSPEDAELADVLDALSCPNAITLDLISTKAGPAFREWLKERRNRRQIPHRLESAGYVPFRNSAASDGLWKLAGRRQAIYTLESLPVRDRTVAAAELCKRS